MFFIKALSCNEKVEKCNQYIEKTSEVVYNNNCILLENAGGRNNGGK